MIPIFSYSFVYEGHTIVVELVTDSTGLPELHDVYEQSGQSLFSIRKMEWLADLIAKAMSAFLKERSND